jgi:hypothetical protein
LTRVRPNVEAGRREVERGGTTTQYEIVGVVTDLGTNTIEPDLIEPVMYHSLRSSTQATALIRMRGNDPFAVLITPSRADFVARPHAPVADRDIQRDEAAADDWAPPDGTRLFAGDRDRA